MTPFMRAVMDGNTEEAMKAFADSLGWDKHRLEKCKSGEWMGSLKPAQQKPQIDAKTIKAIESVLEKGDRAEVVPVKDGVKVLRVRRETVYGNAMEKANSRKQAE